MESQAAMAPSIKCDPTGVPKIYKGQDPTFLYNRSRWVITVKVAEAVEAMVAEAVVDTVVAAVVDTAVAIAAEDTVAEAVEDMVVVTVEVMANRRAVPRLSVCISQLI